MSNKYYTPEIEEFHVGFEYEYAHDNLNYKKQIYDGSQVLKSKSYYDDHGCEYDSVEDDLKYIRVKHLDREDIESLGFKLDQCTKDGCVFYKGNLMTKEEWCLTLGGRTNPKNYLSIHSMKGNSNSFTGIIKNKSELKKLLKQLGL